MMQVNPELARQHAHITAVQARIATRPRISKPVPIIRVRYVAAAPPPTSYELPKPVIRYASPHYDHVRVWRRVERARRQKGPRVEDVVDAACEAWNVTRDEILRGQSVRQECAQRRRVVMYLCRQLTGLPLADIGARLCRDHTTVLAAHRDVRRLLLAGAARNAALEARITAVLVRLGLPLDRRAEPQ